VVGIDLERPLQQGLDLGRPARFAQVAGPLAVRDEEPRVRAEVAGVEMTAVVHEQLPDALTVLQPPEPLLEPLAARHPGLPSSLPREARTLVERRVAEVARDRAPFEAPALAVPDEQVVVVA